MFLKFFPACGLAIAMFAMVSSPPNIVMGQEVPKTPAAKKDDVWKAIKSTHGNFFVEFPGRTGSSGSKNGTRISGSATFKDDQETVFTVRYDSHTLNKTEAELLDFIGGKVLARNATTKTNIKLGDHPGIEFAAGKTTSGQEKNVRGRVFAVKDWIYQLTITSNPTTVVPEETVAKFFNSFRLLNEDAKATPVVAKPADPKNVEPKKTDPAMPKPKDPVVAKPPVVDEKYVPGPAAYDSKITAAERAMLPAMRLLPRPSERRVENLGVFQTPFNSQAYGFSPDGSRFAIVGVQETWILETATGRAVRTLPGFKVSNRMVGGLRFSADGKILLLQEDKIVRLVSVETGKTIRDVEAPGPILDAILSSEGSTLTVTHARPAFFSVGFAAWNTKDGTRKNLPFPETENLAWCFAPGGDHLIVSPRKHNLDDKPNPPVEAWNLLNGRRSILPVKLPVAHMALNADNRTLLVTTARSPEGMCEYHAVDLVTGADRKITSAPAGDAGRLTADGKYLLTDTPAQGFPVVTRLLDAATGKEVWSQENGSSSNYILSPGGTLFVRTPYYLAESEVDVFALDDMLNPKWAGLAGAMDKARAAGFQITPYGNQLRAKAYSPKFTDKSLPELANVLPQTTIVEFRDLNFQSEVIARGLPELAKVTGLEQLELRQSLGEKPEARKGLAELKTLKRLELNDGDAATAYIKDLPKLEELTVQAWKDLTDAGLKNILGVKTLRKLTLGGNALKITDKGFAGIGELKDLRSFSTRGGGGRVTGAVFAHLKNCPKLEKVELSDAEMTNDEVAVLGTMPQLTELTLEPMLGVTSKLTEAGLARLAPLKNLRVLRLPGYGTIPGKALRALDLRKLEVGFFGGLEFSDADLAVLKPMTNLRELWVYRGPHTPAGLDQLKGLTNLRRLHIASRPEFSGDKIDGLRKELPKTVILRSF